MTTSSYTHTGSQFPPRARTLPILADPDSASLSHAEWLALLLEHEISHRHDRRIAARLRYAKLRHQVAMEDVDYRAACGLDRALFQKLSDGAWINAYDNLILCGPTGVGKSWLASALGHKACRDNHSVLYQHAPKLFADLTLARADGRHRRLLRGLISPQLLILDERGLEPLDANAKHDLMEILEDRYGRKSTIVTSQVPAEHWHQLIGDPTYADAILDRLVHNATRIDLTGESMRRKRAGHLQNARPGRPKRSNDKSGPASQRLGDIIPESRATSSRNGGRHRSGIT